MRISIISLAILALAVAACDGGDGGGEGPGADTTTPAEDTTAPEEDTIEPPREDTIGPPPEDTVGPPPEDTVEPPPEDTIEPPPEDTIEPPPEDTVEPPPEDTVESAGACDNDADFDVLAAVEAQLSDIIGGCVMPCFGQGVACYTTCVQDATGLSDGCADCFGQVMDCTVANCAFQCIDSGSPACADCQENKCAPAFLECAGVPMS